MRLLNTSTRLLSTFMNDGDVPPYAILSHTWGLDEVSFREISSPTGQQMEGHRKIFFSCDQARLDGIEWLWLDTYAYLD
jgi:hypothetical protein